MHYRRTQVKAFAHPHTCPPNEDRRFLPTFAGMHLIEVKDHNQAREFIRVNVEMNQGNPNYIRPLEKDINDVFDPKKNKAYRAGEATRWILKDDEGKLLGRIAAFVNKKYKNKGG